MGRCSRTPRRDLLPRASTVRGVEVTRIHGGLWRWSVQRDGIELASAYLEHGEVMLLVDPVLPEPGDELSRFERAIARDLDRLGGPARVLLTRADDPRDAEALVAMTGGTRWMAGQDPPPGIDVMPVGPGDDVAFWSVVHRALMPGRALVVDGRTLVAAPGVDAAPLLALDPAVIIPSVGTMPG